MAMALGPQGRRAEINVTPLIDVVLVLLIIFMVITPMLKAAHQVDLPSEGPARPAQDPPLVLLIEGDEAMKLDGEPVAASSLASVLETKLALRRSRDLVVSCDAGVAYQRVVAVIDVARRAGVARIGVPPASDPR